MYLYAHAMQIAVSRCYECQSIHIKPGCERDQLIWRLRALTLFVWTPLIFMMLPFPKRWLTSFKTDSSAFACITVSLSVKAIKKQTSTCREY